ncbi:glutamate racemase [Pelotomaculum isophthalicicum JI]|uniref:Glutamate racemase n=2 Tax=Pelotomaculum TaxID=191373 RepID=A0A9X4JVW3_9FIRM|nr:glutamate racemase [Pelotomaculum isophthalicicum]MDF9409071.1 glutamate racemase [Pelotomaculum isophthalicicum JI]
MSCDRPIGLFDSGMGGLSVMREVRCLLPAEDLLYFADSAYCPYGSKPPEVIRARAFAIGDFLIAKGVKMIVIASNTTTVASLDAARKRFHIPVVGVEPAVKPAVSATCNGNIGVLATGVTLAGERFSHLLEKFGDGVNVYTQPCPGLVELVEAGKHESPEAEALISRYLDPMLAREVDTIVLGCTHYPFLRPLVEKQAGSGIKVIDTGEAVAKQVARVLKEMEIAAKNNKPGRESFYTSGDPSVVEPVVRFLWGDSQLTVKKWSVNKS